MNAARVFDIRYVIALLFAIYGAVLTVMAVFDLGETSSETVTPLDINLWAGLGMLAAAAALALWARLRPVPLPDPREAKETPDGQAPPGEDA